MDAAVRSGTTMTANRKRKQKVRKLAAERDLDYSDALEVFNEREARWRPTTVYDYLLVREMPERRARRRAQDGSGRGMAGRVARSRRTRRRCQRIRVDADVRAC